MIGRRKGYRVALVMPDNVTNERRQMAALFGAEVIDSPGRARARTARSRWPSTSSRKDARFVMPYQYGNAANPRAHYETTGPEILADCPEIDVFVAGLGHGRDADGRRRATCASTSRASGSSPPSRCPASSVQGLRSLDEGFVPEILDPTLLDAKYLVSQPRRDRGPARPRRSARGSSPGRRAARCSSRPPARRSEMESRDDRRAAPRRRLEVPVGGHVHDATSTRWRTRSRAASTGGERPSRALPRPSLPRDDPRGDLIAHARAEYPNEACGLIVGDRPGGGRRRGAPLRGRPATRRPRRTATRSTRTTCSA